VSTIEIETATGLSAKIAEYERARQRGVAFILAAIGLDGAVPCIPNRVTFYRVPWTLAVSGETEAAHRVLNWIERTGLSDGGEFHGGLTGDRSSIRYFASYPETCLAYGAQLLRRFDLARRTMDWANRFHDPASGGIFMDHDRTGPDDPQLIFLTAQFGMTAALMGRLNDARSVGRWFRRLWEAQPELPDRLYTIWRPQSGLATSVPEDETRLHYINENQEIRQLHYNGGIAAACLTHIAMATGEPEWLTLARAFQQFSIDSTPGQFETRQVCKSAWGSGLLTLATGSDTYCDWLQTMGDWFVAGQESDGCWNNTPYLDPNPPLAHSIEMTAEFIVHLDTLIAALATTAARRS
jgi:hypothetical protein